MYVRLAQQILKYTPLHRLANQRLSLCATVPNENAATIAACASVVEGVSRSRNALLNGDTRNYDWDSGYTCHQLGSGAIVIQLAQPYAISSLRLVIWLDSFHSV